MRGLTKTERWEEDEGLDNPRYFAHSKDGIDPSRWQLLKRHLDNASALAAKLGEDAGVSDLAAIAALLHDLGKYSTAFQARLKGSKRKVDHATGGARTILDLFNKNRVEKWIAMILAYCIAGHHTGLPDYGSGLDMTGDGTLSVRLDSKKTPIEDFHAYTTELDLSNLSLPSHLNIKPDEKRPGFSLAFLTRMVYSTLVDADFQETETYMNEGTKPRGGYKGINELCQLFNESMQQYDHPKSNINQKRLDTLKACIRNADMEQGVFTLTVPTGGGKTLSSMAFALNHARRHDLKRIIYVIPFTTIIEQNATVFKEHLGEENVLEHHSNFDWSHIQDPVNPDDETRSVLDKLKIASENWDIPVVLTTNVQFFESLFANRSSRCRKLHNLAKSVIIFDEAQMLPREYLDPCMLAVKELVRNYGTSAVFCTATQPALEKHLTGMTFTELAPDPQALFDFYKRIRIKDLGTITDAELIQKMQSHAQALCIVNTRKHAKGLFGQLKGEGVFHLSTLMCPVHRKETLKEIRQRLSSNLPCLVISTQVMEAGIDVDFPVGYRAMAGLDSIIQAAGRVNREMKKNLSDIFVFEPDTLYIKKTPVFIKQGASAAENIMREYPEDPNSVRAIKAYYELLYNLQDDGAFDVKRILDYLDKGTGELDFDFKTVAEKFSLIENNTVAVVIPYNDDAERLLEKAKHHPYPFKFSRQLQAYTVNIYQHEFEKIKMKGAIETYNNAYEVLTRKAYYDRDTGIVLPADMGGDAIYFD